MERRARIVMRRGGRAGARGCDEAARAGGRSVRELIGLRTARRGADRAARSRRGLAARLPSTSREERVRRRPHGATLFEGIRPGYASRRTRAQPLGNGVAGQQISLGDR
ncbi:hypothetical protein DB32_005416 [Sandaracinus amylolyticus]|uniref:Uncharacterized protein n=1 Tax=Sandaracinus amylolyticus TaxID=927083 RepID=A0A0F6W5Y4_9BACT|nr:hypothetical protein DB32_005416 [Sandaracinus amylolyticus]